jgi:hypothetical protein
LTPRIIVPDAQVSDVLTNKGKLGFYHEFASYWNDGHFDEMFRFFAEKEAENQATHFVFYHGQNNVITAYQDLIKVILKIDDADIRVFRLPKDELDASSIMSIYQHLDNKKTFDGQFKHLFLSASENIFAGTFGYYNRLNLNSNSESALSYFFRASADGGSLALGDVTNVLSEIFDFCHISQDRREALRQEFNQIVKDYNFETSQSLVQILIPKDLVNDLVCIARPTGCIIRFKNGVSVRDYLENPNLNMLDYWQYDIVSDSINCTTKGPYIQGECKASLSCAPQVRIYLKNEPFLRRRVEGENIKVNIFNRDRNWPQQRRVAYLRRIFQLATKFNN